MYAMVRLSEDSLLTILLLLTKKLFKPTFCLHKSDQNFQHLYPRLKKISLNGFLKDFIEVRMKIVIKIVKNDVNLSLENSSDKIEESKRLGLSESLLSRKLNFKVSPVLLKELKIPF